MVSHVCLKCAVSTQLVKGDQCERNLEHSSDIEELHKRGINMYNTFKNE